MQSKQVKTPRINGQTKILSFDLESNGLHGEAFAVGAVIMDASGKILDQFTARTKIVGQVDVWVEQNVLPAVKDMPITHKSYKDLRESFWQWFVPAQEKSDYVLVSNGYPVEYRFLIKCQEDNLEQRYWQHPFPILDLFSLLALAGDEAHSKAKFLADIASKHNFMPHNPLDDAKITAMAAFGAFKNAGRLN